MPNLYSRFLLICVLLLSTASFGQLSNFTFSVTPTNETCTGNGAVAFTVSDTTPGASMLYSIYLLPNTTTPITVTAESDFEGLTSGQYLVVATQTLNGNTNSQSANVTISNEIENLSYQINLGYGQCQLTAIIGVAALTGYPAIYEVLSGPQTFGPQASNFFEVAQGGTYVIRVTDECGEAVVQTYTFSFTPGALLPFSAQATTENVGCNQIAVNQTFNTVGNFAYPLQVTFTATGPDGTQTSSFEITTGGANSVTLTQNLILEANQTYSYLVTVVDACGYTYTDDGELVNDPQEPVASPSDVGCDSSSYTLYYASAGTITEAPAAYPNALPFELVMTGENSFLMQDLPNGTYTILALDLCGVPHEVTFTVEAIAATPPLVSQQLGCEEGFSSLYIKVFEGISEIEMTSAPASYSSPLPQNLLPFLDATLALRLANLPAGNYTFHIVNTCGMEWTIPVTVQGLVFDANIEVTPHCGAFDLNVEYTDNSTSSISFWLQKYNPVTGNWGNPITGQPYVVNTAPGPANAVDVSAGMNLNLLYTGHFRVISYRTMFSTIDSERYCLNVLGEFDILSGPVIQDAYSFSCNGATFDVVVAAIGTEPLEYRITTFNGNAFLVDNGNSSLFTGLQPGTYNFQVEDACHNIANRLFEISEPYTMEISADSDICEGSTAVISVPDYSFLSYSWYMGSPSNVLSTSATLEIEDISAADIGLYHVHIFTNNPESCIDITLDYAIDAIIPNARAGNDSSETYCGNQGNIDLSAFLSGDFQAGGVWSETTASGTLSGNIWDASAVAPGTYVFVYTKSSACSPDDISVHSFTINAAPANPIPFIEQDVCAQGDLQLLSTTVDGATYAWTGPNGFSSSAQNPVIPNATSANNGVYSVQAFIGSCASEVATLEIALGELPTFSLSAQCQDDRMLLLATSASTDEFTFAWMGPEGFTSSQNPADITGNAPGAYTLTVTNQAGCSTSMSQNIAATLCKIPQGISANGDGANDSFDLSGFGDGLKVKIFNRYGMVVYEMNNYVDQWHGQCKDGSTLPSATYYYYVQNAEGDEKTGWVYLIREN